MLRRRRSLYLLTPVFCLVTLLFWSTYGAQQNKSIVTFDSKFQTPEMDVILAKEKNFSPSFMAIWVDGKQVVKFEKKERNKVYNLKSITKSIVGLITAKLISENYFSLDSKLSDVIPKIPKNKSNIRIRDILNHRSGVFSSLSSKNIYESTNIVKFFNDSLVYSRPGRKHHYNHNACNFLPYLIKHTSGQDVFSHVKKLFPEFADEFRWDQDRSGNYYGMSAFYASEKFLHYLGGMILKSVNNKQNPGDLQTVFSQAFSSKTASGGYINYLVQKITREKSEINIYKLQGIYGQYLIVVPQLNLIAVRVTSQLIDYDQYKQFNNDVIAYAESLQNMVDKNI